MKKAVVLLILGLVLCGCDSKNDEVLANGNNTVSCSKMEELVNDGALLIDVRTAAEYKEGHLEGAINIEYRDVLDEVNKMEVDYDKTIIVYCKSGNRSDAAYNTLKENGYKNIYDIGAMTNCSN